jgi:hypothetical protein
MTALDEMRRRLDAIPDPQLTADPAVEPAIADSVRYLASDDAMRSLDADVYWPKWTGPWWHMVLLFEMGEARRIPERASAKMAAALAAFKLKIFPIHDSELPDRCTAGDIQCHCALGCMAQVLAACGRDVDRELPWIESWLVRYQMADGGLNCDEAAYRVTDECASSMVGTVAPLEAMLLGRREAWSAARAGFVERAGQFLIGRRVMLGSSTVHNAAERDSQAGWLAPCFPRFYLYDVLRGLAALVRWAEVTERAVPLAAIAGVIDHLRTAFPDGAVQRQRLSYAGVGTWLPAPTPDWKREPLAFRSPLLEVTSAVGAPCPYLTRQWSATRRALIGLIDAGRVMVSPGVSPRVSPGGA